MSPSTAAIVNNATVFTLVHIESYRPITVNRDGIDYLACFLDENVARLARTDLGLDEHCDVFGEPVGSIKFSHLCIDGDYVEIKRTPVGA